MPQVGETFVPDTPEQTKRKALVSPPGAPQPLADRSDRKHDDRVKDLWEKSTSDPIVDIPRRADSDQVSELEDRNSDILVRVPETIVIETESVPEHFIGDLYQAIRVAVLVRDHWRCQKCGAFGSAEKKGKNKLNVHHKDRNFWNMVMSNLITYCVTCHAKVHFDNKDWDFRNLRSK